MPCGFVRRQDGSVRYEHDPECSTRHSALKYREPWRFRLPTSGKMVRAWERLSAAPPQEALRGSLLGTRVEPLEKPPDLTANTMGVPEEDERRQGQGSMPKAVARAKLLRIRNKGRERLFVEQKPAKRSSRAVRIVKMIDKTTILVIERGRREEWKIIG